jgi:DNA recombination protein RmuC
MDLILVLVGFLLGFGVAFIVLRKKEDGKVSAYLESEVKNLTTKLDAKEKIAAQLQQQLHSFQIEQASFIEREKAISEKYEFLSKEKDKLLTDSKTIFESIATNIIEKHSQSFKDTNKNELSHILNPLKDSLKNYQETINAFSKDQNEKTNQLDNAIKRSIEISQKMTDEASNLATALQNKKVQGNWGEMVLESVLQWAGLVEGEGESGQYEKQVFFKNENNERQYPDFIIKLPKDRKVIIDSKMSIENYKNWANEIDEVKKNIFLDQLVKDIKNHIEGLAKKEYQNLIKDKGLDFVIMFIPIEYAYFAAINKDSGLIEFAGSKKIAIATASSLFPILKVVEGLWRIDKSNKNNEEIIKAGEEMHKRVERFVGEMENLGKSLKKSADSYEDAMKCLTGTQSIIKSSIKLENLGIRHQKSLKNVEQGQMLKLEGQTKESELTDDEIK